MNSGRKKNSVAAGSLVEKVTIILIDQLLNLKKKKRLMQNCSATIFVKSLLQYLHLPTTVLIRIPHGQADHLAQ